ncbi:PREDICTED: serine/threonine-protein kinase RIO3-like [Dufourea novaeangliae]|uniref:Serine/threonine-protein kinase RIO3 n=1 Tax=Dufourea novaeangliae TaxID=178035 RepID=A0A154PRL5_DUFNO|nr:PREDICTED: serine/threonine-protein kinase RIO3-like [Dufourea novaeangliae]XP_015437388.1 PREDICTED: serine/threonine-protein kinase RIO3-like [Dufourea novaeangliae]XP_015437390.1 PREDICTED: serine/threonine-protein kinase RIO3-like [Dufourea novaeangliae]KZC14513.1 Serine/threonine-protein kinase RIO3 [Dufourea novaeangliae]
MSTPWAKIQPLEGPVNLLEITSEQLANSLQEKEIRKYQVESVNDVNIQDCALFETNDTDSDEVIAHMMQDQYNKEYDLMIKRTEEKFNRDSKVNISYTNYRTSVSNDQDDKDNTDIEDAKRDFDRFVSIEKEYASIPRCGYKKMGEGSQIVTKHDMLMTSRINACRVLQFPPGIDTGDTGGFDVKLNNKVFNSLRAHSHAQCSRQKAKTRPHTK